MYTLRVLTTKDPTHIQRISSIVLPASYPHFYNIPTYSALPRVTSGTDIYHVMLRGINRQDIFEDQEDYVRFLTCMQQMLEPYDDLGNRLPPLCTFYAQDPSRRHRGNYQASCSGVCHVLQSQILTCWPSLSRPFQV